MKNRMLGVLFACLLIGCSAAPLKKEAVNVRMTVNKEDIAGCQRIGEVVGSQGWWIIGFFTSYKNMFLGGRNRMFNYTASLGGNRVLWRDTQVLSTSVTNWGEAYQCPDRGTSERTKQ